MIILKGGLRVGEPGAPVQANDPVPGKPGSTYEAGQFAPNIDELMSETLGQANSAGLLSKNVPFIKDGEVDSDLLNSWNPYEDFSRRGINISAQISKFSLAVLASSDALFPTMLTGLNVVSVQQLDDTTNARALVGQQLITASTTAQGGKFKASLVIYPEFQQYITVPVVRAIKGRTSGVSVSSYALLKAMGHILFSKIVHEGQFGILGEFLESGGWSKVPDSTKEKGNYLTLKNSSSYSRSKGEATLSEIEKYSPQDDFADSFAQYVTHRRYMQELSPEKSEIMAKIMERYPSVLQNNVT